MRERGIAFGPQSSMLGVVTEPAANAPRRDTAIVLLNAGFLHRVGPNRLSVRLARQLAEAGFWVMRFDFSGLGDSLPRYDKKPLEQAVVDEVGTAMDVLTGMSGVDRFLLSGLCSGADSSVRVAAADDRVVGVGLIDFYYEPSFDYYVSGCRRLLVSTKTWGRLLRGKTDVLRKIASALSNFGAAKKMEETRAAPTKERFVEELRSASQRDVDLCFVFSANGPSHYHYKRTFGPAIRTTHNPDRLHVEVVEKTDHLFTKPSRQEQLLQTLVTWACSVPAADKLQTA